MRDRRNILNEVDCQSRCLQSTDCGFPTRPGSFNINVNLPHPILHRLSCGGICCSLRRKRCALSGTFKPLSPRTGPYNNIPAHVRNRHNGIVKRCLYMSNPYLNILLFTLPALLIPIRLAPCSKLSFSHGLRLLDEALCGFSHSYESVVL